MEIKMPAVFFKRWFIKFAMWKTGKSQSQLANDFYWAYFIKRNKLKAYLFCLNINTK